MSATSIFISNKQADAISNMSQTINIGEILFEDYDDPSFNSKYIFDGKVLNELYKKITGNPDATYNNVVTEAKNTLNSEYFYTKNQNNALTLTINGLEWNIVYLSTNRQEEPILTLWLANNSQSSIDADYRSSQYNEYGKPSDGITTQPAYPANMYGTSKVRSFVLNNGGFYFTKENGTGKVVVQQSEDNPYAIFTMPNSSTLNGDRKSVV